jgi:hypothetical protein
MLPSLLRKGFSFPTLLGVILALAALLIARTFKVDPDTWWHLVIGRHILVTHSWPRAEIYSFSAPGSEWMAHEWLAEVILALAARWGGLPGLMAVLFGLSAGITLLTYYYSCLRCNNAKAAFVATLLLLPLAGVWFTLHPQLFGYILLLVTLICIEHFRRGHERVLWVLPLVFLVWVNTHGTFTLGFVMLALYGLGGAFFEFRLRKLVAHRSPAGKRVQLMSVALVSLLTGCITPYGARLLANPLQMMWWQRAISSDLTSWQPIPLTIWHGKFFLAWVLLFVIALVIFEPEINVEEFALILFAVGMTALHTRALPLFAIVFAPFLANLIAPWIPRYDPARDQYILNAFLIAAFALAAAKAFPSRHTLQASAAAGFPVGSVEYMRHHPTPEPMFNDIGYAGYLLNQLGTGHRLFIDGRLEIYSPAGIWADYLRITEIAPESLRLLRRYNIQSCLIPTATPLATLLAASSEWQKVYGDEVSVLYERRLGPNGPSRPTTHAAAGVLAPPTARVQPDSEMLASRVLHGELPLSDIW